MKRIDNSTATEDDEFTDGNPGAGTPATILPAEYLNVIQAELAKMVEMAGITLDQTAVDVEQVSEALAVHVAGLDYYNDTGAADAYVLSAIGVDEEENKTPPAYFDGMRVRFIPDNNNTGAATAEVDGLAAKSIKRGTGAGTDPSADEIVSGAMLELYFDETNDVWKFAQAQASTPAFESQLLHIRHEETSGTSATSPGNTNYNEPGLNTVVTNQITGASFLTGTITLPAGTYFTLSRVPVFTGSENTFYSKARLYNTDDASAEIIGSTLVCSDSTMPDSKVQGLFTLAAQKDLELQVKFGTGGMRAGTAAGFGDTEVYSEALIWKVG